ncbi:hypothetical protein PYW07_016134 [Mythimna separata]|uniref:Uncharacterized protein n=1 Tax=Mythimna separata TaxID=271217 RepID=A0AAD7YSR7_MYTSE|nr:hypothetical protein PYW07_016134 [Mythimna separata]
MSHNHFIIAICIIVSWAGFIAANSENTETTERSEETLERRCFKFTWLGPRYNQNSIFLNATCQDSTRLASGVPCVEPLVASYDGSWPDVHYIWRNHLGNATCLLYNNDVCAQFTYYFDGQVDNSTYMCTRAVDVNGQAITSGCYEQRNGSFVTRACFCRSVPGALPCNNNAFLSHINIIFLVLVAFVMLYNSDFGKINL